MQEEKILDKLKLARDSFKNQDYPKSISLYSELTELLKDDSENLPIIQIEYGWACYQNEQYPYAIKNLLGALKSPTLDRQQKFDCLRTVGFAYNMMRKFTEAHRYMHQALEIDVPDNLKRFTYFELGKMLFTEGRVREAEQYLKTAEPLFSEEEKTYKSALAYYLGFCAYFGKNFEVARRYFDYVIVNSQDTKTQASGYFGLAHLHYSKKDYIAVLDLCEKIMRIDPAFFDKETLGYFMCWAYLNLNMLPELKTFFTELESNYPTGRYANEYPRFKERLEKHSM